MNTTLVSSIIVFGMLVFFHELGHFSVAKLSGIKVHEFSLGFGPQILKFKDAETEYSVRILPLGGFVKMEGEDANSDDPRAFNKKSVFTRLGVILAGPLMNFILAILLITIIGFSAGITTTKVIPTPGEPAQKVGVVDGDIIYAIDAKKVTSWDEVVEKISKKPGEELSITVKRDKEFLTYNVKVATEPNTGRGVIGIQSVVVRHSLIDSIKAGYKKTFWISRVTLEGLIQMIRGKIKADVVGPVGMIQIVGEAAKTGVYNLLYIAAIISINLGLFNLFPIPALDGGRAIFLIAELLRGKPVEAEKEGLIHFIGFALLMALMIFVLFKDIRQLDLIKRFFG